MQTITWRVQEVAGDGQSARVVPQLRAEAVVARLDEVAGRQGWTVRYSPFGIGVGCELVFDGIAKSAIVEPARRGEGPEECGGTALARAAELFGLLPPVDGNESYWVDYDPDEDVALIPDPGELESARSEGAGTARVPTAVPPVVAAAAPADAPADAPIATAGEQAEPVKPEGQQAIDRLVERLKAEGSGLEAARLLVKYGGYGSDPQAARELYGKLRELLARRAEAST